MPAKLISRKLIPLFSLACIEIGWRSIVELFEFSDLVLVPIGGLLVSKELLDAAAIGQFLGLLLFGVATFLTLPEVFPDRYLDWGNDILGRAIVATGVVGASLLFNGLVARLPFLDGGSFNPAATVLLLIGISSLTGLLTAIYKKVGVPQWRPLPNHLGYRKLDHHDTGVPPVGLLVSRVLLILVFGGIALAVVTRLYPLPELFVVGITAYEALSEPTAIRTDIAEGFIAGLRSIWAGPRGVLGVSYGIGGLLFVVWLGAAYTAGLENRAEVVGNPVTLLFGLTTLVVGTLHATTALVRLVERLPGEFGNRSVPAAEKPLIPGLLLPSAALFGWYVRTSTVEGNSYSVSATVPELGITLVLGAIAIVALLYPSSGPHLPFSDYFTIALAPSLLFAIWGTSAFAFGGELAIVSSSDSIINLLVVAYAFTMLALSPFLGYELFSSDDAVGTPDLSNLVSETIAAAAVLLVGSFISFILDRAASLVPYGEILPVIGATFVLPPLAAIVIRVMLILFYVPEQVTNWLK